MASRTPFEWGNANFAWNTNPFGARQSRNPFTWDDCALVEEVLRAGKAYGEVFKDKKRINPVNFYYGNLSPEEFNTLLAIASLENQSLD